MIGYRASLVQNIIDSIPTERQTRYWRLKKLIITLELDLPEEIRGTDAEPEVLKALRRKLAEMEVKHDGNNSDDGSSGG